ncbi:unnamed protein product [Peronospora destructor]|uniref:Uncharacterized protein n=1 Tax=Peronospora destructor TaxID=86335 RepID=A0AAV0VD58_9STRA|nr:unnamed protein product [Peronospora destructor]
MWVTRGGRWVTTMIQGVGRRQFVKVTNVSFHTLILHDDTKGGMWLTKDQVPRAQGFVSVGSRRYAEWLNLAYEATTDQVDHQVDPTEEDDGPLVEVPQYTTPSRILQRPRVPVPIMNLSHRQMPEQEGQSCEERVHQREEISHDRRAAKDTQPIGVTADEEEAKLDDSPQADDQVCTFESGELWR